MKKRKLMRTLLAALCASMLISAMSVTAMADDDVVLDDDDEEVVLDDELDVMYGATYANGATSQPSVTTSPTNPDNPGTGTTGSGTTEPGTTESDDPACAHDDTTKTSTPATCTTPGYETEKCNRCSYSTTTKTDEALGHSFEAWSSNENKHWHNCTRTGCAEKDGESTHSWTKGETTTTENGTSTIYTCTVCSKTKTDTHTHNPSEAWTSGDDGHWHACDGCNEKVGFSSHSWNEGTETTKPTEEAVGVMTYSCTVCGEKKTEDIPNLKHEFSEDWSSNETGHWHECPNCDRTDGFSGHTWNDGKCSICEYGCEHNYVAEKAPVIVYCDKPYTYTVTARCSKCSATRKYNGTNPAAGHDWGAKDENDVAKCSRCNVEAILDSNGNIVRILAEGEDVGREEEIVIKLPELEPEPETDEIKSDDKSEEKTEDKPEEKAEEKPEAKPSDDKQTSSDKPKEDKPKNTTSKPSDNPNSGVTMAILPLAVAAAIVIFKKKG